MVNLFGHELHAPAVRGNREIGYFGVQEGPALHQLLKLSLGICVVQQGPMARMARALQLLVD